MLHLFTGSDREKARAEMNKEIERAAKKARVVRVTDASTIPDLETALQNGGMFAEPKVVVLESVLENKEMREVLLSYLPALKDSSESFFMFEEKPDAATRKLVEKYAETSKKFDHAKKAERSGSIFALANALRRGDKKALWIQYQRELRGSAPEAIHGVLFWGAKDMVLKARAEAEGLRARRLVAELAELPHLARRNAEELEYALERFILQQ